MKWLRKIWLNENVLIIKITFIAIKSPLRITLKIEIIQEQGKNAKDLLFGFHALSTINNSHNNL